MSSARSPTRRVRHEATYVQPSRHHNPMEPSATLARWQDGTSDDGRRDPVGLRRADRDVRAVRHRARAGARALAAHRRRVRLQGARLAAPDHRRGGGAGRRAPGADRPVARADVQHRRLPAADGADRVAGGLGRWAPGGDRARVDQRHLGQRRLRRVRHAGVADDLRGAGDSCTPACPARQRQPRHRDARARRGVRAVGARKRDQRACRPAADRPDRAAPRQPRRRAPVHRAAVVIEETARVLRAGRARVRMAPASQRARARRPMAGGPGDGRLRDGHVSVPVERARAPARRRPGGDPVGHPGHRHGHRDDPHPDRVRRAGARARPGELRDRRHRAARGRADVRVFLDDGRRRRRDGRRPGRAREAARALWGGAGRGPGRRGADARR